MIAKKDWDRLLRMKLELQLLEQQNENDKASLRKLSTKFRSQSQAAGKAKTALIEAIK